MGELTRSNVDYGRRIRELHVRSGFSRKSKLNAQLPQVRTIHDLLSQKYLMPHLKPPSSTVYEEDRDALAAQFDAAEALLKEIQEETRAVRESVEAQKVKVDQATEDVQAAVKDMREGEVRTRDEMREIREEINSIRDMLPKVRLLYLQHCACPQRTQSR